MTLIIDGMVSSVSQLKSTENPGRKSARASSSNPVADRCVDLGAAAELYAAAYFATEGWEVWKPLAWNGRTDLLIRKSGETQAVQVKVPWLSNTAGGSRKRLAVRLDYDHGEIDLVAVSDPRSELLWLLPWNEDLLPKPPKKTRMVYLDKYPQCRVRPTGSRTPLVLVE